ncbi:alpha/beta hydrolase [Rhodococcoides yunnanense]|uniref:alpha/beta hydrolase n=1 Tax=Rhodococcoides yunnanense TaxID=278209 RepID=UPI000933F73F|nr:alpha/beta hydrolase [Rhodococcus yunnanensis]
MSNPDHWRARIDPELARVAQDLHHARPQTFAAIRTAAERQLADAAARRTLPPVVGVDLVTPEGVPIRLYRRPRPKGPVPVFVWIHGGGFTAGSAGAANRFCADVAARLDIAVANVEYRLAPAHPFPEPLDDCYSALTHLAASADAFGLDSDRFGVGGASSGGALAASTVLLARDKGEVAVAFQLLDVPMLDDRLATRSAIDFTDTPGFTSAGGLAAWTAYLGPHQRPGDPDVTYYAAPARASDLSGLPRTYVATAELDPLRDEAIEYAARLSAAGVGVEVHSFPGTFHGSEMFAPFAAISLRAAEERLRAVAAGLAVPADDRVRLP